MAYSANGYEFTSKRLSRVSYDLLTDEQYISGFSEGEIPPEGYLFTDDEDILD